MNELNTSPEIRELEDGSSGYFYSLQQLELMRDEAIRHMSDSQFKNLGTMKSFNPIAGWMGTK